MHASDEALEKLPLVELVEALGHDPRQPLAVRSRGVRGGGDCRYPLLQGAAFGLKALQFIPERAVSVRDVGVE